MLFSNYLRSCWHRAASVALALSKWVLLAVPTGLVCGAVGTAFHFLVDQAAALRAAWPWLLYLLPAAGVGIAALYRAVRCEGLGTDDVIRSVRSGEDLPARLVPAIFLGTVLTHLCGGSSGREGAALQMGGSIGWNLGGLLRFQPHDRRTATICGMAAFFSALFGTPLSATLFAMMVQDVGMTFSAAFLPSFLASLIAYGVSEVCGVPATRFFFAAPTLSVETALRVGVLSIACALVARLFCTVLHHTEHGLNRLWPDPWVRAVAGGALVVLLSLLMGPGRYNGAGMEVITTAVEQGQALPWDFLCKALLTAVTLAAGFKGGEVVPSFFIGATFGCCAGPLLGLPAGFSAAMGMVAVFCGATNTLVPSIALSFELFSGQGIELAALACGLSYTLSGYNGLYSSQNFLTDKLRSEYRPDLSPSRARAAGAKPGPCQGPEH